MPRLSASSGWAAAAVLLVLAASYALGQWIEERCLRAKSHREGVSELFADWREWAERAGEYVGSVKRFSELMAGRMAVLISHRFSTVRMADRILVLADGRIEEQGTHSELLAVGGTYAELFELQAAGYR